MSVQVRRLLPMFLPILATLSVACGSGASDSGPTPPGRLTIDWPPQGALVCSSVAEAVTVAGRAPPGVRVVHDVSMGPDDTTHAKADGSWTIVVAVFREENELTFRIEDFYETEVVARFRFMRSNSVIQFDECVAALPDWVGGLPPTPEPPATPAATPRQDQLVGRSLHTRLPQRIGGLKADYEQRSGQAMCACAADYPNVVDGVGAVMAHLGYALSEPSVEAFVGLAGEPLDWDNNVTLFGWRVPGADTDLLRSKPSLFGYASVDVVSGWAGLEIDRYSWSDGSIFYVYAQDDWIVQVRTMHAELARSFYEQLDASD